MRPCPMISSHHPVPLPRSICNLLIQIRNPLRAQDQRQKRRQQKNRPRQKPIPRNHSNNDQEIEYIMKKIMIGLSALLFALFTCKTASAYGHASSWGGSSSHSYGSSSRENAYGGGSTTHSGDTTTRTNAYGDTATHTAGQGTSASNSYGGSAYHAEGSGTTTASNAYGESATHYQGYGTVGTTSYYGYHPPTTVAVYGSGCYNC